MQGHEQTVEATETTEPVETGGQAVAVENQSRQLFDGEDVNGREIDIKVDVMERYRDKGWAKKIVNEKGEVDLEKALNQIDNLETLVGKKVVAFDWKNATEEQVEQYWQQVGVKDHTEYDVENVPEFNRENIQKLLHSSKIPPKLAKNLVDNYLSLETKQVAELYSEKGFKQELAKNLGDDFKPKADKVRDTLKNLLSPEELTYMEQTVPNATIGLVYKTINNILEQYGVKEGGISARGTSGAMESSTDIEGKIDASAAKLHKMKNTMGTTPEEYKAELSNYMRLNVQLNKSKERK
jgi:hypothetical protein